MTRYQFEVSISNGPNKIAQIQDYSIQRGHITFLFGESGIGKTILTQAIYGLIDTEQLDVTVNGQKYHDYIDSSFCRNLQQNSFFVFQEPSSHLNPLLRLDDQLNEGSLQEELGQSEVLQRLWDTEDDAGIRRILEVFPKPHRPSGGEKQRILLAMAFKKIRAVQESGQLSSEHLFVFDEPSGSLDNHFRNLFLELLLEKYRVQSFTTVFITHDYSIISQLYQQHQDLLGRIDFRELRQMESGLALNEFEATRYSSWLSTIQPDSASEASGRNPSLMLYDGYRVFGQQIKIRCADDQQTQGVLSLLPGRISYVKAPSGVGKTTMAKIIMGLIRAEELKLVIGKWRFTQDTPEKAWRASIWGKKITMVFQHADEALNLRAKVKDAFGGLPRNGKLTDEAIISHLNPLFDFDVDAEFLNKRIGLLSGGQKQRLNILRSLFLDTDILIMDEPLNGLDFDSIRAVLDALKNKCQEGKAILLISHNEEIFDSLVRKEDVYYLTAD